MLLSFGITGGFRRKLAVALLAGVAATVLVLDSADARGRRRGAARGGGYNPPYSAIVVDANSGQVLHAAEADGIRHPASLTKIMTLYLLFERMDAGKIRPDTPLRVSAHAAAQDPTKLGLRPGETITAEDAIRGLVTRSANDAAVVIAEAIGGDEDSFAKMMTRKARSLGMTRTVYMNASGLPNSDQVTSARDQAVLGRAIQERFPSLYRYFSTPAFTFRGKVIRNHNHLLGSVQGVDGIKTGYVRASGFNLVTSMHRNNRHLVAVVLGGSSAGSRDARMRSLLEKYVSEASTRRTAPTIADAGEAEPTVARASVATAEPPAPVPTRQSTSARSERAVAAAEPAKARPIDPIKPIQVKTIKVKLGGVQTATLTPPLAHLPVVPADDRTASAPRPATTARAVPAPAAAPAPVASVAVAAAPAPVAPAAAPTPVTVRPSTPAAQITAAAATDDDAPAFISPAVVTTTAPAPAAVAQPGPAREAQRTVVVASASAPDDTEATFALATAKSDQRSDPAHKARSGWLIQIGAYGGEREAKEKLNLAQSKAKHALNHADPFTEAVVKEHKTFYRARFAGFDEKTSAEAACKALKRADIACLAIKN